MQHASLPFLIMCLWGIETRPVSKRPGNTCRRIAASEVVACNASVPLSYKVCVRWSEFEPTPLAGALDEAAEKHEGRNINPVCRYACMHACMHACIHVMCMSVCLYVCMNACVWCMHVCLSACMSVCLYVLMQVCIYACTVLTCNWGTKLHVIISRLYCYVM